MAECDCIVDRLERVSLGISALQRLGELVVEVGVSTLSFEAAGAPLMALSAVAQEELSAVIVELKRGMQ